MNKVNKVKRVYTEAIMKTVSEKGFNKVFSEKGFSKVLSENKNNHTRLLKRRIHRYE